jgi:hypothetical protein
MARRQPQEERGDEGSLRNIFGNLSDRSQSTASLTVSPSLDEPCHGSATSLEYSPGVSPAGRSKRRSMGQRRATITQVLSSPVRMAKDGLMLASPVPRRLSAGAKSLLKSGQLSTRNLLRSHQKDKTCIDEEDEYEDVDFPRNATNEEKMAILLCRELEMLDF